MNILPVQDPIFDTSYFFPARDKGSITLGAGRLSSRAWHRLYFSFFPRCTVCKFLLRILIGSLIRSLRFVIGYFDYFICDLTLNTLSNLFSVLGYLCSSSSMDIPFSSQGKIFLLVKSVHTMHNNTRLSETDAHP